LIIEHNIDRTLAGWLKKWTDFNRSEFRRKFS